MKTVSKNLEAAEKKKIFIVEENLFLLKVLNVFDTHCSLAEILQRRK